MNQNTAQPLVSAAIIVIGDELLSGRTKDKNAGYLAERLTQLGIQLREVRIIPDDQPAIIKAVNTLRAHYDYVFTTGGIGPTHDDITADAIAAAFGVPIDVDERALDLMRVRYSDAELTGARRRMARIPQGAELIKNIISHAPGFMLDNVIVLAGVPPICEVMFDKVAPRLRTGRKLLSVTVPVDLPESRIAEPLTELVGRYPDVSMGSYPRFADGRLTVQIVLRGFDADRLAAVREALEAMLAEM